MADLFLWPLLLDPVRYDPVRDAGGCRHHLEESTPHLPADDHVLRSQPRVVHRFIFASHPGAGLATVCQLEWNV